MASYSSSSSTPKLVRDSGDDDAFKLTEAQLQAPGGGPVDHNYCCRGA